MKNSIKHLYLNKEVDELVNNSILSTGFCGLQRSEDTFEYVASFIEHSYFETLKDTLAHGATQEAVNNDDLTGVSLLFLLKEFFIYSMKELKVSILRLVKTSVKIRN